MYWLSVLQSEELLKLPANESKRDINNEQNKMSKT